MGDDLNREGLEAAVRTLFDELAGGIPENDGDWYAVTERVVRAYLSASRSPRDLEAAVEAMARSIDPRCFSDECLSVGCGSGWHYEAHSSHSSCPSCGSTLARSRVLLRKRQREAQAQARKTARAALAAALPLLGLPDGPEPDDGA